MAKRSVKRGGTGRGGKRTKDVIVTVELDSQKIAAAAVAAAIPSVTRTEKKTVDAFVSGCKPFETTFTGRWDNDPDITTRKMQINYTDENGVARSVTGDATFTEDPETGGLYTVSIANAKHSPLTDADHNAIVEWVKSPSDTPELELMKRLVHRLGVERRDAVIASQELSASLAEERERNRVTDETPVIAITKGAKAGLVEVSDVLTIRGHRRGTVAIRRRTDDEDGIFQEIELRP